MADIDTEHETGHFEEMLEGILGEEDERINPDEEPNGPGPSDPPPPDDEASNSDIDEDSDDDDPDDADPDSDIEHPPRVDELEALLARLGLHMIGSDLIRGVDAAKIGSIRYLVMGHGAFLATCGSHTGCKCFMAEYPRRDENMLAVVQWLADGTIKSAEAHDTDAVELKRSFGIRVRVRSRPAPPTPGPAPPAPESAPPAPESAPPAPGGVT